MNRIFHYIFLVLLISSCRDKYEFRPIDEFEIVENGLQDNEKVRVLYYSRGPYDNQIDQGFYRHAVVQSTINNETLNVLTTTKANVVVIMSLANRPLSRDDDFESL